MFKKDAEERLKLVDSATTLAQQGQVRARLVVEEVEGDAHVAARVVHDRVNPAPKSPVYPFPVFGTHDENTLNQMLDVHSRAVKVALMADGHLGYHMPIGGVAAYRNAVSIPGVGVDIACGNCAVKTNWRVDPHINVREGVAHSAAWGDLASTIFNRLSFGAGRKNQSDTAPVDHPLFEDPRWDALPKSANRQNMIGKARSQLGTIGGGNHYVDVFVDGAGYIWVGVHFGSRGVGFEGAHGFWNLANGDPWVTHKPIQNKDAIVSLDTELGHDYFQYMELMGDYAYAGREWVCRFVAEELMGVKVVEVVHNHHNFAWKEQHWHSGGRDFEELVVVRKGATPAWPGQRGFVGGSMGDNAVILQGANYYSRLSSGEFMLQEDALFSTVHGAGRVMSRTAAAGKYQGRGKKRRKVKDGQISYEMRDQWLKDRGVILRGGGLDEAPQAYRRLDEVLEAQGRTVEVLHTLRPLIVCMAPEDEFDRYKD